jgi:small GTP-binding protein
MMSYIDFLQHLQPKISHWHEESRCGFFFVCLSEPLCLLSFFFFLASLFLLTSDPHWPNHLSILIVAIISNDFTNMSTLNIAVVGGTGVGKSALSMMFIQGAFVENYDPTVVDSYRRTILLVGKNYLVTVWDTVTDTEDPSWNATALQSQGFLLAYNTMKHDSLDCIHSFRQQILRVKGNGEVPMVLVGNKSDLTEGGWRGVEIEEGMGLGTRWGIPFFETSAKTNSNIKNAFHLLLLSIIRSIEMRPPNNNGVAKVSKCTIL